MLTRNLLDSLRRARATNPTLQRLHLAGGPSPSRQPPSAEAVAAARRQFSNCFEGLLPADGEMRHSASPWRWAFFKAIADLTGDSDTEVAQ